MNEKILDSSVDYLLNRTSVKLYSLLFKKYDVTQEKFIIICPLIEEESSIKKKLALRTEKDPPGITLILDGMVSKD